MPIELMKGKKLHEVWPDAGPTSEGPKCRNCDTETELVPRDSLPPRINKMSHFKEYLWCSGCGVLDAVTEPKYLSKVTIKEASAPPDNDNDK
jgi:Pyruvate/2-oxoacid:ferredoxin oxidoreductase delta subunit